jgi:hypothetical protein
LAVLARVPVQVPQRLAEIGAASPVKANAREVVPGGFRDMKKPSPADRERAIAIAMLV